MRPVYENINIVREAIGMNKRELSKRTGIPEQKLYRYLWGATELPADVVGPLAKALGVDPGIFYDDALTDAVNSSDRNNDNC